MVIAENRIAHKYSLWAKITFAFLLGCILSGISTRYVLGLSSYKDLILGNMYELKMYSTLDEYLQQGMSDKARYTIGRLIDGQIAILEDAAAQEFLAEEDKELIRKMKNKTPVEYQEKAAVGK